MAHSRLRQPNAARGDTHHIFGLAYEDPFSRVYAPVFFSLPMLFRFCSCHPAPQATPGSFAVFSTRFASFYSRLGQTRYGYLGSEIQVPPNFLAVVPFSTLFSKSVQRFTCLFPRALLILHTSQFSASYTSLIFMQISWCVCFVYYKLHPTTTTSIETTKFRWRLKGQLLEQLKLSSNSKWVNPMLLPFVGLLVLERFQFPMLFQMKTQ